MLLNLIIVMLSVISLVYGSLSGNLSAVSVAAVKGAEAAVSLGVGICGMICLWSGIMAYIIFLFDGYFKKKQFVYC